MSRIHLKKIIGFMVVLMFGFSGPALLAQEDESNKDTIFPNASDRPGSIERTGQFDEIVDKENSLFYTAQREKEAAEKKAALEAAEAKKAAEVKAVATDDLSIDSVQLEKKSFGSVTLDPQKGPASISLPKTDMNMDAVQKKENAWQSLRKGHTQDSYIHKGVRDTIMDRTPDGTPRGGGYVQRGARDTIMHGRSDGTPSGGGYVQRGERDTVQDTRDHTK